jgi:hypothetical protein
MCVFIACRLQRDVESAHAAEQQRQKEEAAQRAIADRIRKEEEYRQWLEDQKKMRIVQRCQEKVRVGCVGGGEGVCRGDVMLWIVRRGSVCECATR